MTDQDVLIGAMARIGATERAPQTLSQIYKAFIADKPLSRHGNTVDDLKDVEAQVRSMLNVTPTLRPEHRLFTHRGHGVWALSELGEQRAARIEAGTCPSCGFPWDELVCNQCGYDPALAEAV